MDIEVFRKPIMVFLLVGIAFTIGTVFGKNVNQEEVIDRFMSLPDKPNYTQEEVIVIICGELQL